LSIQLACLEAEHSDPDYVLAANIDIWQRIRAGFSLPEQNHPRVDTYIKWYSKHPRYLDRVAERGAPYLYHIVNRLEEEQLPLELALLPIVESAFDPFAYSHGRAAGMWQFVPATGKAYGLKQNWWYDGRRDVVASTEAAIAYLTYLHKYFNGDWMAALAAYNSGEGTVKRAQKRNRKAGKPDDYWSLKLPKETAAYVPQLIALSMLVSDPDHYGIKLTAIENKAYFQQVPVGSQIDLAQAAQLAEISIDELYKLNPGFNRWATDPTGPHQLLIPIDKTGVFVENLKQLPPQQRVGWERYTIKSGDSLIKVAKQYHTDVKTIQLANKLSGTRIKAGDTLMIPVASAENDTYLMSADQRLARRQAQAPGPSKQKITYVTQAGDSFWKIAQRYKVSTRALAKWNGLAPTDTLSINQSLVIWTDANAASSASDNAGVTRKVHYKVRSGDSLSRIAQKFNVSVKQIKQWNKIANRKYLQPGDSLTLFVDVTNTY
jgi:membrane-bound lytic murein transglycosylase D